MKAKSCIYVSLLWPEVKKTVSDGGVKKDFCPKLKNLWNSEWTYVQKGLKKWGGTPLYNLLVCILTTMILYTNILHINTMAFIEV